MSSAMRLLSPISERRPGLLRNRFAGRALISACGPATELGFAPGSFTGRAALLLGKPAPGAVFLQVPNNRPAFKTTPRYTGTRPWGYAAARVTSTVT